jgi:hypothetical protein
MKPISPKFTSGQTGDLKTRLTAHNKEKEFWERALILISRTNSLTQTHALFLEWHCLQSCRKAGRYIDLNGNNGSKPHTPAPLEADCIEIFETGRDLLATLGFPLFVPVVKAGADEPDEVFYCKASGSNGRGLYTEEGFVVFKGSKARKENVPSVAGTAIERFRAKLQETGVVVPEGEWLVFTKDFLFQSPSMAAIALAGRTANGWLEWKNKDGKTLDALKRQTA